MPILLMSLTACIHDLPWRDTTDTGPEPEPAPGLVDVAEGTVDNGAFLRFDGVVAATGLTRDGRTFFVQTPEGHAGLRVELAFTGPVGPMAPGDVLTLQGYLDTGTGSPRLLMWEPDWLRRETPVDAPEAASIDLAAVSWSREAGRLVGVEALVSLDCPDAIGDIPLAGGLTLSDRFAPHPPGIVEGSDIASVVGVLVEEWGQWQLWPVGPEAVGSVSGGRPCGPQVQGPL